MGRDFPIHKCLIWRIPAKVRAAVVARMMSLALVSGFFIAAFLLILLCWHYIEELSSFIEQEEPTMAECCGWVRNRFFTKRKLKRLFPPASWLPHYSLEDAKGDIVAGISVAFTIVPQGIAYASLAGLPPQYGLYTSFIGCIVYSLLGTCKDMAVGPTSIVSMLVLPYAMIGGPQYAILLAFLCGLLQLISGILNLGFIVDFISFPVISAFSLAASMTIAASQLKGFFGLNYAASRFPEIMVNFFSNLAHTNLADVGLGCLSLLFLLPLQLLKDYKWAIDPNQSRVKQVMNRVAFFFWSLLIISRNAMAVLIGSLVAIYYGKIVDDQGNITGNIFTLTRNITPGVPPFQMPQFEVIDQNNTVSKTFSVSRDVVLWLWLNHSGSQEVYSDLNTGMIVISLVGLIESVAVANAFKSSDRKLDASQEMIAIGASNILGSFFGAFPATGSFSRSAVNHNSGVRTPLGGVLTGGLVLLALSVFSKYFTFIPEAVLAGIVITAVIFMGHPSDLLIIWKTSRIDLLPYLVTFGSSMLIGLDVGILIGIAFSLVLLLYYMARPHIYSVRKMSPNGYPFLYVKPDRSIFFSSIEYMKVKINQNLQKTHHFATGKDGQEKKIVVVVDGEHMFRTDSTFALVSHSRIETILSLC